MHKNNLSTPAALTPEDRTKLISAVKTGTIIKSPQRLIDELVKAYPSSLPTLKLNQNCAIGNISDIAATVNKRIAKHGWFIACQKPLIPFKNRFGQPSQMHLWALHRLPEAANDPVYDPAGE